MKFVRLVTRVFLVLNPVYAFAQGRITGTVYDSLSLRAPLVNATVVLIERSLYATTDSHGRFRMDSVPEGHYTISFMHPVLDSLSLQAPITTVDVFAGRAADVTLSTPSPLAAYARLCPNERDTEVGAIIGRVRDVDDDSPLRDATVSTDWTEFTLGGGGLGRRHARTVAQTNSAGVFILCGVPKQMNLELRAVRAGYSAGPSLLAISDRLIGHIDFAISRRDTAAFSIGQNSDSSRSPTTDRPGTASIHGVVRDGDGRPLRDALVGVIGTVRSARTDGAGTFGIVGIPAGTRTIEARSLGLTPLTVSVDFATNATREIVLSLNRRVQYLKAFTVLGRGNAANDRTGFEVRRRRSFGHFVTQEDLARHPSFDLLDVLARIAQVHIEYGTDGHPSPLMRGNRGNCQPNFFLNGVSFFVDRDAPFADLNAAVPAESIRGVEVYASTGMIPPQFDRSSFTSCGSIIIWTQ